MASAAGRHNEPARALGATAPEVSHSGQPLYPFQQLGGEVGIFCQEMTAALQ